MTLIHIMGKELPENFPEFSIMYKTLTSQIIKLKKERKDLKDKDAITLKIQTYESEIIKIKKKFPDNFFEELC